MPSSRRDHDAVRQRLGRPGGKRNYGLTLSEDVTISAGFVGQEGARDGDLSSMPRLMTEQFAKVGAEVTVTEEAALTVTAWPAYDFRVSFVATNGKTNVWFVRVIGLDDHLVLLQTIGFTSHPGEAFDTLLRGYHRKLVDGVVLP